MGYIRHSQLAKLKEYKYSGMWHCIRTLEGKGTMTNDVLAGVDHSLLSRYVLKPYWWSKVIELFPMSMAPNAVRFPPSSFRTSIDTVSLES